MLGFYQDALKLSTIFTGEDSNTTKYFRDKVKEFQTLLDTLKLNIFNTKNKNIQKSIEEIGYAIDALKRRAEKLQKQLDDAKEPKSFKKYQQAIKVVNEEIKKLEEQRKILKKQMEESGLSFNDPEYQKLLSQFNGITDEIDGLVGQLDTLQTGMNSLSFDNIVDELDRVQVRIEKLEALQNLITSLGGRLSELDYVTMEEELEDQVEKSYAAWQEFQKNFEIEEPGNLKGNKANTARTVNGIAVNSQAYEDLLKEDARLYGEYLSNQEKLINTKREHDLAPLKEEMDTITTIEQAISVITEKLGNSLEGTIPVEELEELLKSIGEQGGEEGLYAAYAKLEEKYREVAEANKDSLIEYSNEMTQKADEVAAKIRGLAQTKYTIQMAIDTQPVDALSDQLTRTNRTTSDNKRTIDTLKRNPTTEDYAPLISSNQEAIDLARGGIV